MSASENRYANPGELSEALASAIAEELNQAIAIRGQASLIVSGGNTPGPVLAKLAGKRVDWPAVWVTLSDERWVEPDSEDSNERMIRSTLLRGRAAQARFLPLWRALPDPETAAAACAEDLASMPNPFDLVLLGMGADGHTASLFPGVSGAGLDPESPHTCLAVRPPGAQHARISLSASALLDSRQILLLIAGETKWRVYAQALHPGPVDELPVRVILHQSRTPVSVFWCPE